MSRRQPEDFLKHDASRDTWQVIFSNKRGLSKDEVQAVFSRFGEIDIIIQTGTSCGFCIVKYKTKEAAMKCITTEVAARDCITLSVFIKDYEKKSSKESLETSGDNGQDYSPSKKLDRNFSRESNASAIKDMNGNGRDIETFNWSCGMQNERCDGKSKNHQTFTSDAKANSSLTQTKSDSKLMQNKCENFQDDSITSKAHPSIAPEQKDNSNSIQTKNDSKLLKSNCHRLKDDVNKPKDHQPSAPDVKGNFNLIQTRNNSNLTRSECRELKDDINKPKDHQPTAPDVKEYFNSIQTRNNSNLTRSECRELKDDINKLKDHQSTAADTKNFSISIETKNNSKSLKSGHQNETTAVKSGNKIAADFNSGNVRINPLKCKIPPRMPDIKEEKGKDRSRISSELNESNGHEVAQVSEGNDSKSANDKDSSQAAGLPALVGRKTMIFRNSLPATTSRPICNAPCCRPHVGRSQAHEVIVANIDQACDVGFIMNLFKDYEPVLVTSMREHEKALRYCHVYFQSSEHAEAVERIFDRMRIYGRELIVLRPESVAAYI
ncbi:uncharacterized protein LOC107038118 [Diachasma alloeum]|uniref:uncharacterized protein LOC107038118 n=1 Tax=Diachasma alloeum TaxID=454923 RepID=UPI0007380FD6|nr:uncharacterized protein LOC107038118 [Diachasma alloeum]